MGETPQKRNAAQATWAAREEVGGSKATDCDHRGGKKFVALRTEERLVVLPAELNGELVQNCCKLIRHAGADMG